MKTSALTKVRESQMLSKSELARMAEVSPITISRIEEGHKCRLDTQRKILSALGLGFSERERIFGETTLEPTTNLPLIDEKNQPIASYTKGHVMSEALTKRDIVKAMQNEIGFTQQKATEVVETILDQVKSTLGSGEDVLISGFGKFCVKQKAKRRGRNPATGEDLMLAPRKVVTFKWAGRLRDKVNGR
jgi:integration host factor subunit alpha